MKPYVIILALALVGLCLSQTEITTNPTTVPGFGGTFYKRGFGGLTIEQFAMSWSSLCVTGGQFATASDDNGTLADIQCPVTRNPQFATACPWTIQSTPTTSNITVVVSTASSATTELNLWRLTGVTRSSRSSVVGPLASGEARAMTMCTNARFYYYYELTAGDGGSMTVKVTPEFPGSATWNTMPIQVYRNQNPSGRTCAGSSDLVAEYEFRDFEDGRTFTGLSAGFYVIETGYPRQKNTRAPIAVGVCGGAGCSIDSIDLDNVPLNALLCFDFEDVSASPAATLASFLAAIF